MNNKDNFTEQDWKDYLHWLKNQIFKLLPLREEDGEWEKFAISLIWELRGANFIQTRVPFMSLIFKLSALGEMADFAVYRKTIFECINLVDKFDIGD